MIFACLNSSLEPIKSVRHAIRAGDWDAGAGAGAIKTGDPAPPNSCQSTFDMIAFEGGGTRGIIYGGAAIALEEAGLLQSACNFAGTSAGSQSAALLAAGYTACELQKELLNQNFLRFVMDKETEEATVVLTALGFDTGQAQWDRHDGWLGPSAWTAMKAAKARLNARKGLVPGRIFARDVDRLIAKKICSSHLNASMDSIQPDDLIKGNGIDTDGSRSVNATEFDSYVNGALAERFDWPELVRKLRTSEAGSCVRKQIVSSANGALEPPEFATAMTECLRSYPEVINSTTGLTFVDGSMWRQDFSPFENAVLHLMTWSCPPDNSPVVGPGRCARFRCLSLGQLPDYTTSAQCPNGRRLAISAYDISNGTLQFLRSDTASSMPISTAVRASSSIPFVVSCCLVVGGALIKNCSQCVLLSSSNQLSGKDISGWMVVLVFLRQSMHLIRTVA